MKPESRKHYATPPWVEELRSAYLYRCMANHADTDAHAQLFNQLALEAEKQAGIWMAQAEKFAAIPPFQPDFRLRLVGRMVGWFGIQRMKQVLAAMKIRGLSVYRVDPHPLPTRAGEQERRHGGADSSGSLRAAVFGVNDGLVSVACLVLGVAGAAAETATVMTAGCAGLLAGAFSMAAGEYISMRSQREMFEYQIGLERAELAEYPEQEVEELKLIYQARGMSEEEAGSFARRMVANPEIGLDALAREELGLNPDELGSPWKAGVASFLAFLAGGSIPLLPFLLKMSGHPLLTSIVCTAMALLAIGATLSLFSGRPGWLGALRMLLIGSLAAGVTYGLGIWIGPAFG